MLVAVAMPVLALAVLPLLPRATRRVRRAAREGGQGDRDGLGHRWPDCGCPIAACGGEELFLGRYRRASPGAHRKAAAALREAVGADRRRCRCCCRASCGCSLVWYGATLADGRIDVGQLVTVYGAVTLVLFLTVDFEAIAMA
ncbi:ABC transporter ATP-binding protein OS=Streptomyces microflavus OX=1919 GN=G3I39_24700 PE=4 SV=1 [Streptomyces microflavus]